jgi:hypothetical protein
MTTPAQNVNAYIAKGVHEKRYDSAGNLVSQHDTVDSVWAMSRVRPQSVSNPVRANKTRKPSGWSSSWLWSKGFDGKLSMKYSPGSPSSHYGHVEGNVAYNWTAPQSITAVNPLLGNARLKALAKVTSDTTQFNAALAQANDTLKLAASFSTEAANQLDNLMSGPKGLAGKLGKLSSWKKIPDRYLAYLYGIAPLADDLENAATQLVRYKTEGFDMALILKASEKRTESISMTCALHNGSSGSTPGAIDGLRHMQARVGYLFNVPSWYLDQAPIVAPFSTAYELTRMSFVLDWFLPVGNWIGAMESAQFSPFFVEGWETRWMEDIYTDVRQTSSNPTVVVQATGQVRRGQMSRSALTSYPSSILTRPACNPLPSWSKAAQGSSLLAQAFKRWY